MAGFAGKALDPTLWHYRDEGGANVVLAYNGSDPDLIGRVLRVRKQGSTHGHAGKDEHTVEERFAYTAQVIAPLLGQQHLEPGVLVPVTPEFVRALNERIREHRPQSRLGTELDVTAHNALLLPDLTQRPTYWHATPPGTPIITVELKPKWAFLPKSSYISDANRAAKASTCRFCMHQYLKHGGKADAGALPAVSKYCPLDLYSNEAARMVRAISSLVHTPQNNLKVYRDNTPILLQSKENAKETLAARVERLSNGLQETFPNCHRADGTPGDPLMDGSVSTFAHVLAAALLKTHALQAIRDVQLLDDLDVEGVAELHRHLRELQLDDNIDGQWDSPLWTNAGTETLAAIKAGTHTPPDWRKLSPDEMLRKVRQFLISTTLKDCSVMIAIQRLPEPPADRAAKEHFVLYDEPSNSLFQFKVTVIDTDPKYYRNILKYRDVDQEIVDNFRALNVQKTCTDPHAH